MKQVVENIKKVRKDKGISHEYIAHQLNISQAAYSKLEKNDTKLTVERLYKIAQVLEVSIPDLLNIDARNIFNQSNHASGTFIGHQKFENLFQENQKKTDKIIALYEARLKDKDALIEQLKNS